MSPTIHDLIEAASLKSHHRDEFNHFFQSLIDNHFVVNSSNPRNIVYQTNADGSGQFLYIDSTGVKQHIPLRRWFKSLNTRKLKNVRESLLAEMKFTDDNSHQSSKATQTPRPLIKLSNQKRITDGKRQNIYEHPDDPTTLIKITKPKTFDSNGNLKERRFSDRFRPATAFRSFLLEFNEFLLLKARNQSPNPALPLCQIRGIAQTDIGLGLLYERISNPDGTLAQPLKQLITSGNIAQQHLDEIEVFFQNQINNHVVVGNFNPLNIVYQINADGSGRFVWIDSFGSKQFIPIRSWFKSQNARKIRKIRALHVGNMQAALKRQPTADK